MLLRLLRLGLLSLLFVHQTRPTLSIKESVKELIVERSPRTFDLFTVYMKPNRTCGVAGTHLDTFCTPLGATLFDYTSDRSSCKCQCFRKSPFTFLSSIQRCAYNVTQVEDFGGELSKHHTVEPRYNEPLYKEVLGENERFSLPHCKPLGPSLHRGSAVAPSYQVVSFLPLSLNHLQGVLVVVFIRPAMILDTGGYFLLRGQWGCAAGWSRIIQ